VTAGVVALLLVGWVLAGFLAGLWLGERGRRKDVQWWTGLQQAPTGPPAAPVVRLAEDEDGALVHEAEIEEVTSFLLQEAELADIPVPVERARQEAETILREAMRVT
jgi:hypothetical protein